MISNLRLAAGFAAAALCFVPASMRAAEDTPAKTATPAEKTADRPAAPGDVTTQGEVTASGQHIVYNAIAGTITVGASDSQDAQLGMDGKPQPGSQLAANAPKEAKDEEPTARMFYVAYFKRDAKADSRPITFFYNGGPGSSTMWLHLGSLGPKYVETDGDTHLPGAPYKLSDNPYSLLDVSDLVFIDMPGTGFGALAGKDAGKAFWGLDQDANAFARFIARFLAKYDRWNSPKFLFGESYGTTRSAVLASVLENEKNIDLNGVVLLGEVFNTSIDTGVCCPRPAIDLPYELALPTYAATAWYHKKLSPQPPSIEPFLKQVEDFSLGEYMHALAKGADISDAEKQAIAEKIHDYTGLPIPYVLKANLRVDGGEFLKAFEDDKDMTTGRYDTRFLGPNIDSLSQRPGYDPQSAAISSAYMALINSYLRNDLKYGTGQTYLPGALFGGVNWNWTRQQPGGSFRAAGGIDVGEDLAEAMKVNPHLRVMVNGGYYDMATPFFAAEYEEKHLPIPQSLTRNIEFDWYESGHMTYVRNESRKQLHDRVAAFITRTEVK